MADVTRLVDAAAAGDPKAAAELLPLVYDELRKLAKARIAAEPAGQTLEPTALVHEAYLRLVGTEPGRNWNGRGHFFAAAAEAMRRILVEKARRKRRLRHGRDVQLQSLDSIDPAAVSAPLDSIDLLALNDALGRLEQTAPRKAELVKLRYFAGLTVPEAAGILGISKSTAEADWTYAKAWLKREMEKS
jgi:RNA polymerase sigma factor (TIGR02999 family)